MIKELKFLYVSKNRIPISFTNGNKNNDYVFLFLKVVSIIQNVWKMY